MPLAPGKEDVSWPQEGVVEHKDSQNNILELRVVDWAARNKISWYALCRVIPSQYFKQQENSYLVR